MTQLRWLDRHFGSEAFGKHASEASVRLAVGAGAGVVLALLAFAALAAWLERSAGPEVRPRVARSFALLALTGLAPFVDHHVLTYVLPAALVAAAAAWPYRAAATNHLKATLALPDDRSLAVVGVFFASGFAALVYQLVWQRTLFTIYGSNVESAAMVVTAFMLGLGLGSLAGGALSRRPGASLVTMFGVIEIGIGAYGVCSLWLFARADELTLGSSAVVTGSVTFALVLLPTLLMGATLPLLVEHFVKLWKNVGRTVGLFYFVNTLGSAAGALSAATWLFQLCGQTGTVFVAASINVAVGGVVLTSFRGRPA
jgi:hypothetical protein